MRPFHLIVACSENRVIGRNGRLPWSIEADRRFFEERTAGQILIMGRVCFETWPSAVREGRRTIVVSERGARLPRAPAAVAHSLAEALAAAATLAGEIYLCGGQRLYEEGLAHPDADRLYLTLIHAQVAGDRTFPDWKSRFPVELARRDGEEGPWRFTFLTLARRTVLSAPLP